MKLPLFAYNLMTGKWEVFPFEMLKTMPNGKQGFTWDDCMKNAQYWYLLNNHWYSFDKHIQANGTPEFYTVKETQVPDLDQGQREVGTDPILGDDHV